MFTALRRPNRPRRGVTLVEMLVVVALVVLMMVILVQIFQSATGAMSLSRTTQELDVVLRQIDSMIRADLAGTTAKMTPPNDPALKQGYFEYMENAAADLEGEDTDDTLAFTTKAPEGQVFTGRQWLSDHLPSPQLINQAIQPATVSSQVAEVIYFVRNGNLYRRVFLVAPERAKSITRVGGRTFQMATGPTSMFGGPLNVSWQGMNDISCRPGGMTGLPAPATDPQRPGRPDESREPRLPASIPQRLQQPEQPWDPTASPTTTTPTGSRITTRPSITTASDSSRHQRACQAPIGSSPRTRGPSYFARNPSAPARRGPPRIPTTSMPSRSSIRGCIPCPTRIPVDPSNGAVNLGWVHYLPPSAAPRRVTPTIHPSTSARRPTSRPAVSRPGGGSRPGGRRWPDSHTAGGGAAGRDPDPLRGAHQRPHPADRVAALRPGANPRLLHSAPPFLPPVTNNGSNATPFGFDGAGSSELRRQPGLSRTTVWEDDLILTGVRSFDVKAYDMDAPLYNQTPATYLSVRLLGPRVRRSRGLPFRTANASYVAQ